MPIISDLHLEERVLNIQESRYLETSAIKSRIQIRSKYKTNISKDTFFLVSSWQFEGVGNQSLQMQKGQISLPTKPGKSVSYKKIILLGFIYFL